MKDAEITEKRALAYKTFTPSTPINAKDLFLGRSELVLKVIETISRPGQHVIMFGERGVGKTSLGNVIHAYLPWGDSILRVKVNCSSGESFSELWKGIFRDIELQSVSKKYQATNAELVALIQHLVDKENPTTITPNDVRFVLSQLPTPTMIVIDELDRIENKKTVADIADTVKTLSDYAVPSTLILIGVGDSLSDLVEEHASITRALSQIPVPRMSADELHKIVKAGMSRMQMEISPILVEKIVRLSRGLPHYTHLLALEVALSAIKDGRLTIREKDYNNAISESIRGAQESIKQTYSKAVMAPRGKNYGIILLACALSEIDEMNSTFAPADVGRALKKLTGRDWALAAFTKHLHEFATPKQGSVLVESGTKGQYRYKFKDPIIQPFIILKGISDGEIQDNLSSQK